MMKHCLAVAVIALTVSPATADAGCGLYQYRVTITDVYDGDTVTADIDLGFNVWRRGEKLRLFGINAPEVKGAEKPQGLMSRDALRDRILGKELIICTVKDRKEKYGRYLANIYDGETLVNDWLVSAGYAVRAEY